MAQRRRAFAEIARNAGKPVRLEDEREGIWGGTVMFPILDAQGQACRLAVVARNITERKRAEERIMTCTSRSEQTISG